MEGRKISCFLVRGGKVGELLPRFRPWMPTLIYNEAKVLSVVAASLPSTVCLVVANGMDQGSAGCASV